MIVAVETVNAAANSADLRVLQQDLFPKEMTEPGRFGFNPFSDRVSGWGEQVHLDDDMRASEGSVPDSLDGTVDQNDRKSPALKIEDLALVGLR
ncbi:MAG TPA: hypothetical protein VFN35_17760, partial [Ktedonobacteraceae bacterium]|nr:hypothetical protein [Ktedonobacteraceae bacterium]